MVKRLAEVDHIGFRRTVVGHVRQSMGGAECRHQHHRTPTALDEPAAEAMGEFEMCGGVENETAMEVCEVLIHEAARAGGAGVGDQQTTSRSAVAATRSAAPPV